MSTETRAPLRSPVLHSCHRGTQQPYGLLDRAHFCIDKSVVHGMSKDQASAVFVRPAGRVDTVKYRFPAALAYGL